MDTNSYYVSNFLCHIAGIAQLVWIKLESTVGEIQL